MHFINTQKPYGSAQKETTFMNTLIQYIPTFNGSNSTQLEDWLVDIKTAANLTDEAELN